MSFDIRPCSSEKELRAAIGPIWHYFGRSAPLEDQFNRLARVLPHQRMFGAWESGNAIGGLGAFAFDLAVPGGRRVPAAGITVAGTLPTHRRQGVLRALMRAQLEACRGRQEPVAYLWATDDALYGRFGFGIASFSAEIDILRERSSFWISQGAPPAARLVPLDKAEALIAPIYERVAIGTPGMFARTSEWWRARTLADPDWRRDDNGELLCAVLELDGEPAAYALYRMNSAIRGGLQTGSVSLLEAMGRSPEATCAIWRYLLDIDWMARVRAWLLPLDHPILLLAEHPRRLGFTLRDGLWVRLVDVKAALSVRRYQTPDSVVIEVADEFCPWNEGRWRVGGTTVERTDNEPDLRCDVTALGSVYLGGFTWTELVRALRATELRSGAAARADSIFRAECAPWCPEIF